MNPLVAVLVAQAATGAGLRPSTLLPRPHIRRPAPPSRPSSTASSTTRPGRPRSRPTASRSTSPTRARPPSERTAVRVLYDDENLYVGIDCEQVRVADRAPAHAPRSPLPSDGVWIDIDSRRDGVSAFHFGVNAAGVLSRRLHFNDTDYSADWDAVWEAKVADTRPRLLGRVPHPAVACCASRRCRCRTGASRCGASSTRARRPTTGRSTRAAPAATSRCFGRLDGLRRPARRAARCELRPFVLGRARATAPPTPPRHAGERLSTSTARSALDAKRAPSPTS